MTRRKGGTEITVLLTTAELKALDARATAHGCSRAAVIGAWIKLHGAEDLTGTVTTRQRRPGGGRKKAPRKHPLAEWAHLVPELLK